jgi:acetolactate synthase small subunit
MRRSIEGEGALGKEMLCVSLLETQNQKITKTTTGFDDTVVDVTSLNMVHYLNP